jgi:Na+/H+ antiporter NhaD/arsenite permease-like protein
MQEVAKLFAGIFLTIIPVIAMLKAGVNGPFGAIVAAVTRPDGSPDPAMYFWATGALSSFLDNAPTYLVFFNTAGGDPQVLMTTLAPRWPPSRRGRCSWAPTPTSATRPT